MEQGDSPEVIDDFELGNEEVVEVQIKDKDVNKQKLRRRIDQYKVSYLFLFPSSYNKSCCRHKLQASNCPYIWAWTQKENGLTCGL